jgi:hypothetical protein
VDLSDPTLTEDERQVNDNTQQPYTLASHAARSLPMASPSSASPQSTVPQLASSLFPMRAGQQDSVVDTVLKAIKSNAKPATSATRIFKDRLTFDEVMNAQLDSILASSSVSSANVRQWMNYVSFLNKMIDEKGFEAADMYHRTLFVRIADGSHSLFSARGFYCDELVRDVDRTYADIANPMGKNDSRFRSRYVSAAAHSQSSNGKGNGKRSKSGMQSGNGRDKRFSNNKSLYCSVHGQCAHSTADCRAAKSQGSSSSSSKPAAK